MHTPKQAQDLWCPMVRLATSSQSGQVLHGQTVMNRLQNGGTTMMTPFASMCIADKCAMWRWSEPAAAGYRVRVMCQDAQAEVEPERPAGMNTEFVFVPYDPSEGDPACWIEPDHAWLARRRGFCGLAGGPAA